MIDEATARERLLARKEELLADTASGEEGAETVELDQSRVGRLSRMDAIQQQAVAKEAQRRRQVELTRIESALKRLDEGEYGYCLSCDEEISEKRLEIDPASPLCVGCAGKGERR